MKTGPFDEAIWWLEKVVKHYKRMGNPKWKSVFLAVRLLKAAGRAKLPCQKWDDVMPMLGIILQAQRLNEKKERGK